MFRCFFLLIIAGKPHSRATSRFFPQHAVRCTQASSISFREQRTFGLNKQNSKIRSGECRPRGKKRAPLKLLPREVQNTLRNPQAYFKPIIRLTLSPSWDFFQTESFLVTGPCHEDHVSWKDARCPS